MELIWGNCYEIFLYLNCSEHSDDSWAPIELECGPLRHWQTEKKERRKLEEMEKEETKRPITLKWQKREKKRDDIFVGLILTHPVRHFYCLFRVYRIEAPPLFLCTSSYLYKCHFSLRNPRPAFKNDGIQIL